MNVRRFSRCFWLGAQKLWPSALLVTRGGAILLLVNAALLGGTGLAFAAPPVQVEPSLKGLRFEYEKVDGIGAETGVCRRDPSDVIRVGDSYFVYYTKVVRSEQPVPRRSLYPSGYLGTIWCAGSADGRRWVERGEVLGQGAPEAFDSFAVFTPNIIKHDGRFWLFYTGVQPTPGRSDGLFENNSTNDFTAIGVAVADAPAGPFKRISPEPILRVGAELDDFDSYRVDDACLVIREGKVWLYYKGRGRKHGGDGPRKTQMGVAVATTPSGPFTKLNGGKPVQDSGHEVQIWAEGNTVMSLVSATGPNGRTVQRAGDGLQFRVVLRGLEDQPLAPGLHRAELTDLQTASEPPEWGISMVHGKDPYLIRFRCRRVAP